MRSALVFSLLVWMAWIAPGTQAQATCEMTPLTLPLFDGTPVAQLATPAASPANVEPTENDARDVLEIYVACTNTGDPTLVWAMFTPRWFSAEFADPEKHYLPAFEYDIATGHNDVTDPLVLVSIEEVDPQEDGRVAVTATFGSGDMEWTDQLILANVNGQWLIDDVVLISPAE